MSRTACAYLAAVMAALFSGQIRAQIGVAVPVCEWPASGRMWLSGSLPGATALAVLHRERKQVTLWFGSPNLKVEGVELRSWMVAQNGPHLLGTFGEDGHSFALEAIPERMGIAVTARSKFNPRDVVFFATACPKPYDTVRVAAFALPVPDLSDNNRSYQQSQRSRMQKTFEDAAELRAHLEKLANAADSPELPRDPSSSKTQLPSTSAASSSTSATTSSTSATTSSSSKEHSSVTRAAAHYPPVTVPTVQPPPSHPPSIERYPTVSAPREAELHQHFRVKVQLTQEQSTPEVEIPADPNAAARKTERGALDIPLSPSREWPITVTITAPHFHVDGPTSGTFLLKPTDDSGFFEFHLVAEQLPGPEESPYIGVRFFSGSKYLARVVRRIEIVQPQQGPRLRSAASIAPRMKSVPAAAASESRAGVDLNRELRDPDIHVLVDGSPTGKLTIDVIPKGGNIINGIVQNPPEFRNWLRDSLDELVEEGKKLRQARGTPDQAAAGARAANKARGFGRLLYQRYCPPEFRAALEPLIRETKRRPYPLGTIQIQTSDPTFPWELLVPGDESAGQFLGTMFQIARWHHRPDSITAFSERPTTEIVPGIILYISPDYGDKSLAARDIESKQLAKLPGYEAVLPSLLGVQESLASHHEGIVHFAGHASSEQRQGGGFTYNLILNDVSMDLTTLYGIPGLNVRHTLFFFNACHSAEANQYANYVDGWAPMLLDAGASGYIGGLWDVYDDAAADFSRLFYQSLSKGVPVAESLRRARAEFYTTGDPTYLAYAFYGSVFLTPAKAVVHNH